MRIGIALLFLFFFPIDTLICQVTCRNFIPDTVAALEYKNSGAIRWNENYSVPIDNDCQIEVELDVFWVLPNGGGFINTPKVISQITVLNQKFAGTGISFTLKNNDVSPISNSNLLEYNLQTEGGILQDELESISGTSKNIKIVFVDEIIDPLLGIAFGNAHSIPGCTIALIKSSNSETLAHEMGHIFGLYHTFEQSAGLDQDGIFDTPYDDYIDENDFKHSCSEDIVTNLMTYGNSHCPEEQSFSVSQKRKMRDMAFYFFQVENYTNFNFVNCDNCWFSAPTINLEKICMNDQNGFKVNLSFLGKPNEIFEISVKNAANTKFEKLNLSSNSQGIINNTFTPIFNNAEIVYVKIKKGNCEKVLKIENWACNIDLPCYINSISKIDISSINNDLVCGSIQQYKPNVVATSEIGDLCNNVVIVEIWDATENNLLSSAVRYGSNYTLRIEYNLGNFDCHSFYIKIYDPFTIVNGTGLNKSISKNFKVNKNCPVGCSFSKGIVLKECEILNTFKTIEWVPNTSTNNEIIIEICNPDLNQCFVIANPTPDDGSFTWQVGHLADGSILPEGDYYIKMYDPANTANHWTSQFFTISTTCDIPVNCSIPSAATASNITSSNAVISWTASSPDPNFVSYYIEMSYNGIQWFVIDDDYASTTYDFNANSRFLSPCRDYYVRVRSNCSDMSQTDPNTATQVQFTTDGTDCAAIRAGIVGECTSPDENDPIFINCPAGYVFGNDPDQCGAFVNWSIPIANDNCPGVLVSHFSGPNRGDFLEVGDYIVTYQALDTAGNVSYCSFPVSVQDTQNPFIECPQDITVGTNPDVCFANINNLAPQQFFDNCDAVVTWTTNVPLFSSGTSTSSDISGAYFEKGTTIVTYTITESSDIDGNGIKTATCSFSVTVEDKELPKIFECPSDVTISNDLAVCGAIYNYQTPIFVDNCDGLQNGALTEGLASGSLFPVGTTTVTWQYTDVAGNGPTSCTFTILVLDDENPMIFCEEVVATNNFTFETPMDIRPNDVTTAIIHVAPSMTITDFNILALAGTQPDMGDLTVTLTSPAGTTVTLFDGLCGGTADFDLALDDAATASVTTAACGPLGGGNTYISQQLLAAFNGENSAGDWILTFTNSHIGKCGVLTDYRIQIIGNDNSTAGNRLQVLADPGTCTYTMLGTDFNPRFTDNCPDPYIRHNYIFGPFDSTLQGSQFALGENLITWTVYDQSGNTASCNIIVDVLDTQAPTFTNCPRLDIIQNVETERCGAYVTFSEPLAVDNCSTVSVTKTDLTGLNSGSIFPTGMSILEYLATDPSGNTAVCSLRVIVNDHIPPTIECPPSVTESTDPWKCSAIVQNIAPQKVNDNCRDNLSIQYQIEYPLGSGIIVDGGMADASGTEFLDGVSQVTYKLSDQPHLLITEVTHDIGITNGGMDPVPYTVLTTNDYVEITNLGAASINASGLQVERLGNMMVEVFTIPDNTIIGVGQTLVIHFGNGTDDPANLFFNLPCAIDMHTSQGAAYVMSFKGRVLDVVAVNGFAPIGLGSVAVVGAADWTGSIPTMRSKGGVIRKFSFDNHVAGDWKVADVCDPITIGIVNPTIDISPDNGTTIGFQSIMPNMVTCQFKVTILDQELPYCGEFVENIYNGATNLNVANSIIGGKVFKSVINVPDSYLVGDVDLLNILGTHPNTGDLIFKVTSPEGTQVVLFEGLCPATANFDLSLDSDSLVSVINAPCGPLGQGGTFAPINSLCAVNTAFYGENAQGNWTIEIADTTAANNGLLSNWTLRLWEINNYSQGDTTYNNEPGLCGADFTWVHPRIIDNCKVGTVELKYLSDMDIPLPTSPGIIVQADTLTEFFAVGTTTVRYILTDGSGNIDSCEFKVTILDIDRPYVECPSNIYVYLKGGECRAEVCYVPALATDNCAVTDTTYSILPCSVFEIGTTPVTIYIYDAAGNVDSCSFNVVIVENDPNSTSLSCNGNINLSLDENCQAEITPDMLFEGGNYRCYEDYIVTLKDVSGNILATSPFVYLEHEGKTLTYEVLDPETGISCWGTIVIEVKIIPIIECPTDTVIYCSTDKDLRNAIGQLLLGEVQLKSCKPDVLITREDVVVRNGQCNDPIATIYRTFVVSDNLNNQASCTQVIDVKKFDFDQIVWPGNAVLSCDLVSKYPKMVHPDSLGYPTIDGVIVDKVNALCNLSHTYEDQYLWICGSSYEILRKWVIRNRCNPVSNTNPIIHYQLIEVLDTAPPVISACPDVIEFSVDPWSCTGGGILPIPSHIDDKCSQLTFNAYIYGGGFLNVTGSLENNDLKVLARNIKKGANTRVKYVFTDECGNETVCIFNVRVVDKTPPIAIAKQDIVISLVPGYDENGGLSGQATIFATNIDNGSFDGCTDVRVEIRRKDGPSCGNQGTNDYNNNVTFSNSPLPGFNNNINDTDGGEYVKFCCADITEGETYGIVEVEMRVWDDGNMNGIIGDAGDNYNVTWANVRVEYKVPPQITCPPDMTIYCDWAIDQNPGTSDASAKSIEGFDFTKTGLPTAISVCGSADIRFWDRVQVNQCKIGTITRTFLVGTSGVKCVQTIKVDPSLASQPWTFIPSSLSETPIAITSCDGPTAAQIAANAPRYTSGPCDNIGVSTDVKQFDFEQGVCRKWRVEFIYDNWCTDEKRGPFYKYFVYNDVVAPELECEDKMFPVDNDCVAQVVLNKTAIDTSGCIQTGWLKWEVYVDLWADGTNDYLFTSFYAGADGAVRIIDGDAVRQYKLSGPTTNAGSDGATQSGQELRITLPDLIEGSMSNHKVVWKVTDGCHNYTSCHENFMVADKKKPTPVCVPLSTALMADPDGNGPFLPMVELWAVDFMNKAYDNCTEDDKLLYTFDNVAPQVENKTVFGRVINIDVPHYFNATSGGVCAYPAISASEIAIRNQYLRGENGLQLWLPESNSSAKVWTSTSLDPASPDGYTIVDVLVTVWDKKFNSDFCYTSLKLGLHETTPGSGSVSGNVETSEGKGVRNVTILIDSNQPEYPISSESSSDGTYEVNSLKEGLNYDLVAVKDGVYSEGVTTLDLVLIQRHILGIQTFTDNYKLIAADANNDGIVTASDLVELRKLILGLTSKLPNNKSWRFAVKDAQLEVDPLSFEERIIVNQLIGSLTDQDFVAIKIGDVNGNASTDVTNPIVESRSNNDVNLTIAERAVEAGETVAIPVTAANFNEVFGYQFTMNLNGASFVGVESGAIDMSIENIGVLPNDVITMSFASNEAVSAKEDDVLFTMIVKANKAGSVSEMMTLNSDVTATESYVGADMTVGKVSLNVRTADVAEAIELFQNEPNPFKGQTTVSFHMPSAAKASLSVYDVTGKLVTVRNIDAVKGYNSEIFTTAQLGASGVLYYTLVSGDFTATKKMIIVE